MRRDARVASAIGLLVAALALDLVAIALFAAVAADAEILETLEPSLFAWQLIMVAPFAVVGALVAARRPMNRIGWLLLADGLLIALYAASRVYLTWTAVEAADAVRPAMLVVATAAYFLASGIVTPRLLLLIPDGELPSSRWRLVYVGQVIALGLLVIVLLTPGDLWTRSGSANPIGIEAFRVLEGVMFGLLDLIVNALVLVAGASLVVRFRRSEGIERAQLKWVALAGVLAGISLIGYTAFAPIAPWLNPITYAIGGAAACLVPIAIGIAVLRYRLYEIDRLISRTIGWAIVTGLLGAAFVVLVLGLTSVLGPLTGGDTLAVATSTLVVAALFSPVRSQVQAAVDRRFDRSRYDGERLLAAFGERLRDEVDLATITTDVLTTVDAAVRPSPVGLWLREVQGR
jgi:hypothetical protein